MAWYPGAIRKPIPPGSNDPRIIPVGIVLHVDAGNATSLFDYFDGPSGGIESHFHVQRDGDVEQYRDTDREADANYKGNSWVSGGKRYGLLSVETQGFEHGEWTDAQLDSIKDLIVWAADEHDFGLQVAPSWQGPGVGYHVMWGAPGPWTPVAKTCPGPDRVKQFKQIIVPWLNAGATGGSMSWNEDLTPGTPGNDITALSHETLPDNWGRHAADLLGYAGSLHAFLRRSEFSKPSYGSEDTWTLPSFWRWAYTHARRGRDAAEQARDQAVKNGEKLDALLDAQSGLDTAAVLERIDARHAEAGQQRQVIADTMTARLDAVVDATQGSDPAEAKLAAILEILGVDA